MKTNEEVISDFADGIQGINKNVFSEKDGFGRLVLFSYGYHFPIALKLDDGFFIFNKSKYSRTTSRHQSLFIGLGSVDLVRNTDTDGIKNLMREEFRTQAELTELNI